ncbi:MAG TPA: hypothetical protein VHE82_03665 [Gemmatimonadaceae bacterium]|nr:hypothetical protein [Gemmatimonadaceae bacterium]
MKPWMLERLLWTIALSAGATTGGQMLLSSKPSFLNEARLPSMTGVLMYDPAQLREAADSVVATDLFRLDRHPSRLGLGSPAIALPPVGIATPFRLELSGVSGGPPWRAIVSGIPGHDGGVVVKAGDTLGGIRVRTIRRDTMIVQMKDSTMTFILKR